MTKEEAKKILSEYVKAYNENDFTALKMFEYDEVIEAMEICANALSNPSLPSNLDEAAERYSNIDENYAYWIEGGMTAEDADDKELIKKAFKAGVEWESEERNQVDNTLQDRLSYKEGFDIGKEEGKAEALKDLPRWKKIDYGNNYSSKTTFAINGRYLEMNDTLNDVYEIALSDLEKLPHL